MAIFTIKNLTFTYPEKLNAAISNINLQVERGEFIVIAGQTGCGKSTLLRNLKTALLPHGRKQGEVYFNKELIENISERKQASAIGYVLQNPDSQIVTDKVWHELAFGLESLGCDERMMRLRVAETANYFGIQNWFNKDVSSLSGGQKQILNLASIMAMQPDAIILDEPTAQLDPIAAIGFLDTLKRINEEIGMTIVVSEHRLEHIFSMADRVVLMEKGEILIDDRPNRIGSMLAKSSHPLLAAMPAPVQIYSRCAEDSSFVEKVSPVNVRDGKRWISEVVSEEQAIVRRVEAVEKPIYNYGDTPFVRLKDVWFRYTKEGEDIIKGLSLDVPKGSFFCILGGNGSGKTTALKIIGGISKPYRGKVTVGSKNIAMLPQNPQTLFIEKTVFLELKEVLEKKGLEEVEIETSIYDIAKKVGITDILKSHPYDLSGGEQQRVALAKVLLTGPELLLLDEPTKGLDNFYKKRLAEIIETLKGEGVTVIMVSHDIEYCGEYSDICSLFFDGGIVTVNTPNSFFTGNSFYTTSSNRMTRHIFENCVTVDDVVLMLRENSK